MLKPSPNEHFIACFLNFITKSCDGSNSNCFNEWNLYHSTMTLILVVKCSIIICLNDWKDCSFTSSGAKMSLLTVYSSCVMQVKKCNNFSFILNIIYLTVIIKLFKIYLHIHAVLIKFLQSRVTVDQITYYMKYH